MSECVLIVDDDPVQRRLLDNMVRKAGYEPIVAEGGDAAMTALTGPDGTRIHAVLRTAEKAAASAIPVLIEGQSGVGKELIARAIHGSGERRAKPFVAVNCGAIPENLVESLLFGHEKGAFTGATERHLGKFTEASGGTLF